LDVNITGNRAAFSASIMRGESISATVEFCRFESNGDHNGLLFRGGPGNLSFVLFAFNRCTGHSTEGFFDLDVAATLSSCVFYRNTVDSWSDPVRPVLAFEKCTWDADFAASFVTVNCTVRRVAAAELLAPWVTRSFWLSPARSTTPSPRRSGASLWSEPNEAPLISGGTIVLIVVVILVALGCGGGGVFLVAVNNRGEVVAVQEVR
jgi:hypothetical protein